MNSALWLICAVVAAILILAAWGRNHRRVSLEQWALGGRRFGPVLVFLLMAAVLAFRPQGLFPARTG